MNFTHSIIVFLLVTCSFTYSYGKYSSPNSGGLDVDKSPYTFVEDSVLQFKIDVAYEKFARLISEFENSPDTADYIPAGFCFVPIIVKTQSTSDTSQINFYTKGFRVTLALWAEVLSKGTGRRQPDMVKLFSFNSIGDALTLKKTDTDLTGKIYFDLTLQGYELEFGNPDTARKYFQTMDFVTNVDSMVTNTREFDLVFLDILTFEDLAKSDRFFPNRNRTSNFGIVVERGFNTINPRNDRSISRNVNLELNDYRSLIFRPMPVPPLPPDYDSETAVSFSHGYNCPPYWRPKSIGLSLQFYIDQVANVGVIKFKPPAVFPPPPIPWYAKPPMSYFLLGFAALGLLSAGRWAFNRVK